MTRTVHIPDALTDDDVWIVEQIITKLAAIRVAVAELERREGEKAERLTERTGNA